MMDDFIIPSRSLRYSPAYKDARPVLIDINCQSFDVSGQFQVNIFHRKMHAPLPNQWPGAQAKSLSLFLLIAEESACGSESKETSRFYIINRKTAKGGVPAFSFLFHNKPDRHLPL